MNQIIHNYVAFELAGLWAIVWSYGLGAVALLGCAAGWYFSPIHRTDFLWAALVIVVIMTSTSVGVSLGEKRVRAQCDVEKQNAVNEAKNARIRAQHSLARKPSRWMPNHQQRPDQDCRDC